ncbi:MAG: hypothetical protein RMA76_41745 [Deltaproteobacteria bacterium]|jgi:hypothetical protein
MNAALLVAALVVASAQDNGESKSYDVGDLGLDDIEAPAADPSASAAFGVGVNTTLLPAIGTIPGAGSAVTLSPGVSLRLWTGKLMVEPLVGIGFRSGDPVTFRLNAGALVGFSLADGPLRPMLGGGLLFGIAKQESTAIALTFGPMFAVEYRVPSLPQLAFDAALFLPLQFEFDPFVFSAATTGGALVGFHYYFD